ncbi:MAG: TonB-dependent receptor [Prevotella sp.]|nr:TonB-dependent receptor [Prevotella sp.]MBR1880680.1 TonB-dependent receptor [Prevotella sp.]
MKQAKRILLSFLMLLTCIIMYAQQEITGTVTDAMGPVIGATVMEKGTTNGTVTDFDGNFKLKVQAGKTLVFSYIGYKTIELPAQEGMQVKMEDDSQTLGEVVVTGYQVQRKADLTGSVGVVETKDFKTSNTDPMSSLQGKVPGMTITSNGSPSGEADVHIRGIGSMGGSSTAPLYIVDGMPYSGSLNSLNASDIESMQVLKDAASASIYGSRAANGVIVITTKKGKKGDKINIDFNASVSVSWMTQKMKLLNSQQYATALVQAALNDGKNPADYAQNYGLALNVVGGTPITVYNPVTGTMDSYSVGGFYDGYMNAKKTMIYSDTDWVDEIGRTGVTQNYDLSFSKATDKGSSLFSVGYKKALGVLRYTDFENFSARFNSSYKINKIVTVGENATFSYSNNVDCAPLENALKIAPTLPVFESDGVTYSGPVGGMSDRQNPLRELYHNKDNRLKKWRIFANAYVDITPIKGMLFRSNFGIDYTNSHIRSLQHTWDSDVVRNSTNASELAQTHSTKWTWSNTLQYNFDIVANHNLNVLLGIEAHQDNGINFSSRRVDYPLEDYDYMWPDAGTGIQTATGYGDAYKLMSYFGKLDYNWNDQLLASFTLRHDGSSRFGKNNQFGTFPSVSLGYRLSKHINAPWLRDWKIRASYGVTGNQGMNSNTAHYGLYVADYGAGRDTSTAYDINLQKSGTLPSGYRKQQSSNEDLKWESSSQWNFGTDFSLFNNELYGSYDLFFKETKDMLVQPAFLGAIGEGGQTWINGPTLKNWGMEFNLGYRHKTAYGLSYHVNGNIDFYRSKVTYLPENSKNSYEHNDYHNLAQDQKAYGSLIGYVVEGLYQSREEVLAHGQAGARVGGLKYADLNGDGKINEADRTWIFNPVPNFSYGINVDLGYKDFDFTMFWQGVAGVDVINNQKYQTDFWSITDAGSNKGERLIDAWTPANSSSSIPALTTSNGADEGRLSSYFVENGSYIKLRTLQLGYTLPTSLVKKLLLSKARIYLSGDNLWTIKSSSLTCSDPENTAWNYPHTASFTFGIQVGF